MDLTKNGITAPATATAPEINLAQAPVDSASEDLAKLKAILVAAKAAQENYAQYTQAQVGGQIPLVKLTFLKCGTLSARQEQGSTACICWCCMQVDEIFKAAALAANQARLPLAKMAVQETRMGVVEDKVGGPRWELLLSTAHRTLLCLHWLAPTTPYLSSAGDQEPLCLGADLPQVQGREDLRRD